MSALRNYEVSPSSAPRRAQDRLPSKPPQLRAIAGSKGSRIEAVKAPMQAKNSFGFMFLCALILVASLVTVLVLNTKVVTGAYESAQLTAEIRRIDQDIQSKQAQLRQEEDNLPNRAAELGLVKAENFEVVNITSYVAAVTDTMIGSLTMRGSQ